MSAARRLEDASGVDAILTALADPHRRRVVDLLSRGPLPAGELARAVGLAPAANGESSRSSGASSDRLRAEQMSELKRWLEEIERLWAEQLAAFKAHLEKGAA